MAKHLNIKKGDEVTVHTGRDRGKSGKVVRVLPLDEKVVVEGINMVKKHQRARGNQQKGGILEKPMPIHVSNVAKKK